jgi:pyruvate/2-oxoglutarate dehydrogenase complex dihydrolipoamide acyltransferase (E2) component
MTETAFVDVVLVDVGEGICEAQIVEWLVSVGQNVSADQAVVSISTDKATVELPAPASGILREQLVEVGGTVPVGSTPARIEVVQEADGMPTSHVADPWVSSKLDAASSAPGNSVAEEASLRSYLERALDERIPLRGNRLAVARSTTASWRDIPHIVEFRQIDATQLQQTREAYRE